MRTSRGRRLRLVVAGCTLVVLAACGRGSGLSATDASVRAPGNATLKQPCTPALCTGTRGGAAFTIEVPSGRAWNGTLVIYSHGYRPAGPLPTDPLTPSSAVEQPDTSAQDSPADPVGRALLDQGYALAGSAYKTNGWAVQDGVAADKDLYSYFSSTFGPPKRVYLWGVSLGGLITQTLAEQNPTWVSGVAPMCGVLGGTNLNLDLALDVAYSVKTLIDPSLKLTGYASQTEAVQAWESASAAVVTKATKGGAAGIADLLAIRALSGAPEKTQDYDGHDVTSIGQAAVESIVTALGYGTWGRYDIEQRLGGDPSQNAGTDYAGRISPAATTLINAVAPGQLSRIEAALAAGARVTADPAVRSKADSLGNPTGAIYKPTITLHTEDDPLVISQNENVFAARARAKGAGSGQLVQILTVPPTTYTHAPYGAGHCNFTQTELVGVISLLNSWVRDGSYPGVGAISTAFNYSIDNAAADGVNTPAKVADGSATTGYAPVDVAQPWPAKDTGSPTAAG